jgi:ketosteroid isomerase-like protein
MSEENIEAIRQSFAAFNARAVEDMVAISDPDAEWIPFRAQLEGIVYRGHAGLRQFVRDMEEDWDTFRLEPLEFHERGDRVAVVAHVKALGRGSGVEIDSQAGFVFEMRAGLITRLVSYSDPAAARASLGEP